MKTIISGSDRYTGIKVPLIGEILGHTSLVSFSSVCGIAV
jgi:hypothetical protein